MSNRAPDWFRQAEINLEQAAESATAGRHEWACFAAQQAAEMAVKALHQHAGQDAWGHVVRELLETLPSELVPGGELIDSARALDLHYIAARYPNGHVRGTPHENYGLLQSREALVHARAILEYCRLQMAGP